MQPNEKQSHIGIYVDSAQGPYHRYRFYSATQKNFQQEWTNEKQKLVLHTRIEIPQTFREAFSNSKASEPTKVGLITYQMRSGTAVAVAYFPKKFIPPEKINNTRGLAVFMERPILEHLKTKGATHVKVANGSHPSRINMWTQMGLTVGKPEPIDHVIQKMKQEENKLR